MEFDHITYLEQISRESVLIKHSDNEKHFSVASGYAETEELLSNISKSGGVQIVAIDDISGAYVNDVSSNLYDNREYSFMILKPVPDTSDMHVRRNAIKDCKAILRKIIARMNHDSYQASKLAISADTIGLRNFSANTLKYFAVGPVSDNFHGLSVSFSLGAPDLSDYNPNDWSNEIQS